MASPSFARAHSPPGPGATQALVGPPQLLQWIGCHAVPQSYAQVRAACMAWRPGTLHTVGSAWGRADVPWKPGSSGRTGGSFRSLL
jgi:hypothetical protein